ncbi:MAG: hypothetical protein ABIK07_00805 [Planctomycetota bacterium]|uniref:hypothetical protein n=1 Tax=uncultured Gimesia sp. TaxID=1678688 RepID=UPI00261CB692|nr:hypothetical protein [uncultured Gimesia sp.]
MLRGCLFALGFWFAVAGGYWYWFDQVFDPPGSIVGAIFVGLIVSMCFGSIMNARTALRDWSLASAYRNGLRLADGRIVAVSGTIHPVDQPLIAPFSGTECVICEYDLGRPGSETSQTGGSTAADFAGFLMTPCVIRTEQGDIRLLGFPILEEIPDFVCRGFDAAKNGFEFLNRTEFENRTGLKMISILGAFGEVWSDDDGLVQKNMQLRNVAPEELFTIELFEQLLKQKQARLQNREPDAEEPRQNIDEDRAETFYNDENRDEDLEDEADELEDDFDDDTLPAHLSLPRMTEKRIDVGDSVCVIGTYNELQRGLLPKTGSNQPNRLLRGTIEQLEQKWRRSFFNRLLGGLLVLVIVNAAAYGMTQLYLLSPDTINRRQQEAAQAIQNDDVVKLKTLLRRGLDPNIRNGNGRTLLDQAIELHRDQMADLLRNAGARQ